MLSRLRSLYNLWLGLGIGFGLALGIAVRNRVWFTSSHTLVSGQPPACKISFPIYEDYYYYHRRLIDL